MTSHSPRSEELELLFSDRDARDVVDREDEEVMDDMVDVVCVSKIYPVLSRDAGLRNQAGCRCDIFLWDFG